MIVKTQAIFIQQKKMKPVIQVEIEPLDESDQSIQQNDQNQSTKQINMKDRSPQKYPVMYAPVRGKIEQDQSDQINSEQVQVSCWNILFPQFKVRSFNFIYVIILTLYFVATYIYLYSSTTQLYGCTLYALGAKFTPKIKNQGHVHRLIVSIPLFGSILQAIISLLTLLMFGFVLEQYVGIKKYAALLFITGFFSNLLSAIIFPYYITVGSVGSIFGLIALYNSYIINKNEELGHQKNLIIGLFLMVIAVNFLTLIDTKAIDIAGILGGFISGGLLSIYYYQQVSITPRFRKIQIISLIILFLLLIAFITMIFTIHVDDIDISKFCS